MEEFTFSFQELLNPRLETMNYHTLRDSQQVRDNLDQYDDKTKDLNYASRFADLETCTPFKTSKEMFKNLITDDFGDGALHIHTKAFAMTTLYDFRQKIDAMKDNITKIRKPTEIVVLTDGYSYSATSIFIKGLYESGNAIIAGYNGNPSLPKELFDGAQAPSGYMDNQLRTEAIDNLEKLGFRFGCVTMFESYTSESIKKKDGVHIPREYEVEPVDERIDIYEKYNDDLYPDFIEKAKEVLNKYKEQCNVKNTRLVLDDETCTFTEKHTFGGRPCNVETGKWDKEKCQAYYCDRGYYFDSYDKKCKENPCAKLHNNSNYYKLSLFCLLIVVTFLF